jgi:hypothetical protein
MTEDATDQTDASARDREADTTDAAARDREADTTDAAARDREDGDDDGQDRTTREDRDRTARDERDGYDDRDRRSRGRGRGGFFAADGLYERLQWVALVVLVLVAVATLFSFYTNVTRLISIWATPKYEPAIQAAFALAVLASALTGIVGLSRNLQ